MEIIELTLNGYLGEKTAKFSTTISSKLRLYITSCLSQVSTQIVGEDFGSIAEREATIQDLVNKKLLNALFTGGDVEMINDDEYSFDVGLWLFNSLAETIFRQREEVKKK